MTLKEIFRRFLVLFFGGVAKMHTTCQPSTGHFEEKLFFFCSKIVFRHFRTLGEVSAVCCRKMFGWVIRTAFYKLMGKFEKGCSMKKISSFSYIEQNFCNVFSKKFWRHYQNCILRVQWRSRKKSLIFFWKPFHHFRTLRDKFSTFRWEIFGGIVKSAFYVYMGIIWGKVVSKKYFFYLYRLMSERFLISCGKRFVDVAKMQSNCP